LLYAPLSAGSEPSIKVINHRSRIKVSSLKCHRCSPEELTEALFFGHILRHSTYGEHASEHSQNTTLERSHLGHFLLDHRKLVKEAMSEFEEAYDFVVVDRNIVEALIRSASAK
jgi:hypothetical protein